MKKALITGITGQDGSYLAELLLEKGYEVHGIIRRTSTERTKWRIQHLIDQNAITLHFGDLADSTSLHRIISIVRPDELYNLAAQSHVRDSFDVPEFTADVDGIGTLRLLEALRTFGLEKHTRFYQASTSEMFGAAPAPQSEQTPFEPRSPYAAAKIYSYHVVKNYRDGYGMHASSGILFNHESPRRGELFVTRQFTTMAARIALGSNEVIPLARPNAMRDWGHAKDYVEAMWRILQQEKPDDFVIATGEQHSVREFLVAVFKELGIAIRFEGSGLDEKAIREDTGKVIAAIDPKIFRPTEVDNLLGDASHARKVLGWEPKVKFDELVREMVATDLADAKRTMDL